MQGFGDVDNIEFSKNSPTRLNDALITNPNQIQLHTSSDQSNSAYIHQKKIQTEPVYLGTKFEDFNDTSAFLLDIDIDPAEKSQNFRDALKPQPKVRAHTKPDDTSTKHTMIILNNLKTSPEFGKETFVEDVDFQPGLHTLHEEMKVIQSFER